jgi:hypothetical protein
VPVTVDSERVCGSCRSAWPCPVESQALAALGVPPAP